MRAWLTTQDTVFQNCSGGATIPSDLGAAAPFWLRKDRQYQIAAAYFYSLDFDKARAKFEEIAADSESPWHETADYLVARTLVRQASLTKNETAQREIYERAEVRLQTLLARNSSFTQAEQRLLGLIKYRIHPMERLGELGRGLANNSWAGNLKQDLIDYDWLLGKFEAQVIEEERKRVEAANSSGRTETEPPSAERLATQARYEAIERGELIEIWFNQRKPDGQYDYSQNYQIEFNPNATNAEVHQAFETKFGRPLTADESKDLDQRYEAAQSHRQWPLSPNRKVSRGANEYEGCYYDCNKMAVNKFPAFMRADDLTDWIMTLQTSDTAAYSHALRMWRATDSPAWLAAAMSKADKSSLQLLRLLQAAEKIQRDEPVYATVAYHLVRLKTVTGNTTEARKLLDAIIAWQPDALPVSAQNLFLEQRLHLAGNLNEFLKFAQRKPVLFYEDGRYGSINDLFGFNRSSWDAENYVGSKEEYDRQVEEEFKALLPWDNRLAFDDETVEVLNWHFPLETLLSATRSPALPDYLRRELVLAVWTRAVLLKNETIAQRIAPEVLKVAPEVSSVFSTYLDAQTKQERERAALFALLKFQNLSPYVTAGVPTFVATGANDYYLEMAWWCVPSETIYDDDGKEVPRVVPRPPFLTPAESEAARRERSKLIEIGQAKSFLGKSVLEWAKAAPDDERVPEALFITVKANESYKYGCGSWEHDDETRGAAETILRERYPSNPWTARLSEPEADK